MLCVTQRVDNTLTGENGLTPKSLRGGIRKKASIPTTKLLRGQTARDFS